MYFLHYIYVVNWNCQVFWDVVEFASICIYIYAMKGCEGIKIVLYHPDFFMLLLGSKSMAQLKIAVLQTDDKSFTFFNIIPVKLNQGSALVQTRLHWPALLNGKLLHESSKKGSFVNAVLWKK